MKLTATYLTDASSFTHELYDERALDLAFSSVLYEQLHSISLTADTSNELKIVFTEFQKGIATLVLNGNPLYQKELLETETDVLDALKRYINGKFNYKVYYAFNSTPVHDSGQIEKGSLPPEVLEELNDYYVHSTSNIPDDLDVNVPIFKHQKESSAQKKQTQPEIRPSRNDSRSKITFGNIALIAILFCFFLIIGIGYIYDGGYIDKKETQRNNREQLQKEYNKTWKEPEKRSIRRVIEHEADDKETDDLLSEDEEFKNFINENGVYMNPIGISKIISIRDDGAQYGFVLIKLRDLRTGNLSLVYNSQDLPTCIKPGAHVKIEYIHLNGGLKLKHPVIFIDI